jgi:hypothetical protein
MIVTIVFYSQVVISRIVMAAPGNIMLHISEQNADFNIWTWSRHVVASHHHGEDGTEAMVPLQASPSCSFPGT